MDGFVNVWETRRVVCLYYTAGVLEMFAMRVAWAGRPSVLACSLTTPTPPPASSIPIANRFQ